MLFKVFFAFICCYGASTMFNFRLNAQTPSENVRLTPVQEGWAANSVNAVVFRKNSLVTFENTQFIAFYDKDGFVVLGKRKSGSDKWEINRTKYRGNASDAHNTISIMVDGEGYLHIAWDHHNNPLNYCRSVSPGSLELSAKLLMTGEAEKSVSYPEFYQLADGNLLFFYRDGGSGRGNLVLNKYNTRIKRWQQLQTNLIDGEGKRNAYWQACTDAKGAIHISWVWRESPDVSSNHDLCYAKSTDGGITWQTSKGKIYALPITAASAEYICRIPQRSELINQTSMFADDAGNPCIASYWRDSGTNVPQYHVVYKKDTTWNVQNLGFRKTAFSLSGGGTKKIPVSRPQIVSLSKGKHPMIAVIFRDEERGNKVSVAVNKNMDQSRWALYDLTASSVGAWEPTYDTELWKKRAVLNLFIQNVDQVDAEGKSNLPPQMISVAEWKPKIR